MINILHAIRKINPNAEFSVNDNDINQIEWLNGTTPISKADIETKMVELQVNFNSGVSNRVYPPIGDQLDMLWHSIDRDAELKSKYFDFHQAILAVKAKHPK